MGIGAQEISGNYYKYTAINKCNFRIRIAFIFEIDKYTVVYLFIYFEGLEIL